MIRIKTCLAVLGVALALAGCFGIPASSPQSSPTGTVLIHAALPAQIAQSSGVVSLLLTKDKVERSTTVPSTDDTTVVLELHEIPIGTWDALLQLADEHGNVTYEARNKINVFPSQQNVVRLRLQPMPGSIKVHVDLAGWNSLPGDDPDIVEVKMTLAPGGTTTAKVPPGESFVTLEKSGLEPRTIDFHLTLNVQGEKNPVVFYNSPKQPVTVLPGTETVVHWEAVTGGLEVIVDIDHFPNPPSDFTGQFIDDAVVLQWNPDPYDNTIIGFRVYERVDPFGEFKAVADVDATDSTWVKTIVPGPTPLTREYAVSAVNEVFESVRTDPVVVLIPATP